MVPWLKERGADDMKGLMYGTKVTKTRKVNAIGHTD